MEACRSKYVKCQIYRGDPVHQAGGNQRENCRVDVGNLEQIVKRNKCFVFSKMIRQKTKINLRDIFFYPKKDIRHFRPHGASSM